MNYFWWVKDDEWKLIQEAAVITNQRVSVSNKQQGLVSIDGALVSIDELRKLVDRTRKEKNEQLKVLGRFSAPRVDGGKK